MIEALFSIFLGATPCDVPGYTTDFDQHFRNAVYFYYPAEQQDWCWLKAQAIAESDLVETAVSPAGAMRIMQIMPATLGDLVQESGIAGDIFEARYCIMMGACSPQTRG